MSYDFTGLSLLLVDDNRHMRVLVRRLLNAFGISKISEASDGGAAWADLFRAMPDVVLLDFAMEPIDGIEFMQEHRHQDRRLELGRGPGRLCQAFAIDRHFDHWNLTKGRQLWLADDGTQFDKKDSGTSTRIGVTTAKELPLRFFLRDCPYVSGPRRLKQ